MGSKPFALAADDWLKIGKGFLIAASGFFGAWITTVVIPALQADETSLINMALVAVCGVVVNALLRFGGDTRK